MRWQYWVSIAFVACMVVLTLDLARAWPLGVGAVFVLFVLVTQNQRDRSTQEGADRR